MSPWRSSSAVTPTVDTLITPLCAAPSTLAPMAARGTAAAIRLPVSTLAMTTLCWLASTCMVVNDVM
eukprot:CAMPEP_0181385706 /NCGR_PEP_ID=MMETSP1106-20121128/22712_1 /TAXON_ID=81844 /ORGANISM="Mantoniella antarctica, Strain SL-175" /LENGTH=66 /DNA_ID=CAMNT_0023505803 /DNA_START=105 /DNA_END=302 /DNA_ORIENTATION=+